PPLPAGGAARWRCGRAAGGRVSVCARPSSSWRPGRCCAWKASRRGAAPFSVARRFPWAGAWRGGGCRDLSPRSRRPGSPAEGDTMKALCWTGVNEVTVRKVPDPRILNRQDAIVKVTASSTCGSDLHLLDGYVPAMASGDVIGHEFVGEIVETGPDVRERGTGERVAVCSIIGCGRCYPSRQEMYSLCDNTNPNPGVMETIVGHAHAGIFGYSHAAGGFAGSHAEYIRVPYADVNAFPVPDEVSDDSAVFASDAAPTGWMGADLAGVGAGDVVAVWGCGGVGQMAVRASYLKGAERVIAIDRVPERLRMARDKYGAEVLDYEELDVLDALDEMTGGRGPDVCIEAVGMESHGTGVQHAYDRA